jgi:hypothetical protein
MPCDGVSLGIFEIESQPIVFPKASYGKLHKNVVYVRQGSSTAEMTPDELVRSGERRARNALKPDVSLEFARVPKEHIVYSPQSAERVGKEAAVSTFYLDLPEGGFPPMPQFAMEKDYYLNFAAFLRMAYTMFPVAFCLHNAGAATGHVLRCTLTVSASEDFALYDQTGYPPWRIWPHDFMIQNAWVRQSKGDITVESTEKGHAVRWRVPKILPQETVFSTGCFLVQPVAATGELTLKTRIIGENLPEPVESELTLKTTVSRKAVSVEDILYMLESFKNRRAHFPI